MGRNAMVFGHVDAVEGTKAQLGEAAHNGEEEPEPAFGGVGLCAPEEPGDRQRLELLKSNGDDVWLDVRALEIYLQVSKSTAYKLIRTGIVPSVHLGKLIRINKRKLDEALEAGQLERQESK